MAQFVRSSIVKISWQTEFFFFFTAPAHVVLTDKADETAFPIGATLTGGVGSMALTSRPMRRGDGGIFFLIPRTCYTRSVNLDNDGPSLEIIACPATDELSNARNAAANVRCAATFDDWAVTLQTPSWRPSMHARMALVDLVIGA